MFADSRSGHILEKSFEDESSKTEMNTHRKPTGSKNNKYGSVKDLLAEEVRRRKTVDTRKHNGDYMKLPSHDAVGESLDRVFGAPPRGKRRTILNGFGGIL